MVHSIPRQQFLVTSQSLLPHHFWLVAVWCVACRTFSAVGLCQLPLMNSTHAILVDYQGKVIFQLSIK